MSAVRTPESQHAELEAYRVRWNEARQTREQQRRDPNSYVSYASFQKLTAEPQRFDGIPGVWCLTAAGPEVVLPDGESLEIDGQPVSGSQTFAPVKEREFRRVAKDGDVTLELSSRGGQHLLRTLDPALGERLVAEYSHTPVYEPCLEWVVEGEFLPFELLRPTEVSATIGDIIHIHPAVGEVVFALGGRGHRLLLLGRDTAEAQQPGTAYTTFTDATSATTTDPLGRSIEVEHQGICGPVILDFNLARNIQRPYTRFAPCPLPPSGNHLELAVEAGEQLPVFNR